MDSIEKIHERAKLKVSASGVQRLDNHIQELKSQQHMAERSGDILVLAAIVSLLEKARGDRKVQLSNFWSKFDKIFTPGDRIEWFSGWGMEQGVFEGHSEWHVNTKSDSGLSSGHPIIIDTEWEKI